MYIVGVCLSSTFVVLFIFFVAPLHCLFVCVIICSNRWIAQIASSFITIVVNAFRYLIRPSLQYVRIIDPFVI